MRDCDFNKGNIPLCGAYFPTAEWRSGYATGGQHSWWRMLQSKPVYSRQRSTQGVQGGRVSKQEAWKKDKQTQTCDITFTFTFNLLLQVIHTRFLDPVLSFDATSRLMLGNWDPFLFWTPVSTDFHCELWFLNPNCYSKHLKKKILFIWASVQNFLYTLWKVNVQTLICDGIDSDTSSGEKTL